MMQRSFDADRVNELVNDPNIRPFIGGDPTTILDLTAVVADDQNIVLLGEHGGFVFSWSSPFSYEVHTFILPSGRGRWAFSAAKAVLSEMARRGARTVWTRVAPEASNVRAFTLRAGFSWVGTHRVDLGAGPTIFDLFEWRP